ncbi:glycosyltransferase family 4 protein [Aureimonas sp. AU4]|uniref:glycosyltransferase family 4 protein n=1 Tax=Aureimonas sp. AU4 TaxID=1638163 RepID=UPI000780D421|nr:glycosyltransferase family 4 protein [Aureimonas sp. AU4]
MSEPKGRRLVFAIPGDLSAPSGGYGYDRRMIGELGRLGWAVDVLALPAAFPFPAEADLRASDEAFAALPDGTLVLVDGLAFGALPRLASAEASRLRLVALVHHPLALEEGLAPEAAERLRSSEREALRHARAVVSTSQTTRARLAAEFGVGVERITVVPPGTEPVAAAAPRGGSAEPLILCVAALIERKDHAVLVDALGPLRGRPWRCRIVGSDTADPATARRLRERIANAGLAGRIEVPGAVADIEAEYRRADLFALPSRFEGYGMAFAEAMAHALPVVGCAGGAVPEVVPPEAGLLVPPRDAPAFSSALARLLDDAPLRARLSAGALAASRALPGWAASAAILSRTLEAIR